MASSKCNRAIAAVVLVLVMLAAAGAQMVRSATPSAGFAYDVYPRIALLQSHIETAFRELQVLKQRSSDLDREIRDLMNQLAGTTKPSEASSERAPSSDPEEIEFRPPLAHVSPREIVNFVCLGDRLLYVDFKAINQAAQGKEKAIRGMMDQAIAKVRKVGRAEFLIEVPEGCFNMRQVVEVKNGRMRGWKELSVKQGGVGEDASQIAAPGSRFSQILPRFEPEKYDLNFAVYHDSYDIFRKVRTIAWEKGFEVGWSPYAPGESIRLGAGGISTPT